MKDKNKNILEIMINGEVAKMSEQPQGLTKVEFDEQTAEISEIRVYDRILTEAELMIESSSVPSAPSFTIGGRNLKPLEASAVCPLNHHICTYVELINGVLLEVKRIGGLSDNEKVFSLEEVNDPDARGLKGTVLCCVNY